MKEADQVKLHQLPSATGFKAWRSALRKEVAAASGVGQDAFQWVLEVEAPGTTFDDLGDCGAFTSLDTKLGSAIAKIALENWVGRSSTLMTCKR